jgi:hypothetical protein
LYTAYTEDVLERIFKPAYFALASLLRYHDTNGDGVPEHDEGGGLYSCCKCGCP